jgi:hypothetical protein
VLADAVPETFHPQKMSYLSKEDLEPILRFSNLQLQRWLFSKYNEIVFFSKRAKLCTRGFINFYNAGLMI